MQRVKLWVESYSRLAVQDQDRFISLRTEVPSFVRHFFRYLDPYFFF